MQDATQTAPTTHRRPSARYGRRRWSRRLVLRGGSRTATVIVLATMMLLGALTAPASSASFVSQEELAVLGKQVPTYQALARRLQDDAISDVAVQRPRGRLVDATLCPPSWRYLLALATVQCDGNFRRADPEQLYELVRSSIVYSYVPSGPGRAHAICEYPPVEVLAAQLAASDDMAVRMKPGVAAKRSLDVFSALAEGGLHAYDSHEELQVRTGVLPVDRKTVGKLDSKGVAVNFPPVTYALKYRGVPYVWGGMSPSGFDCSGLVCYVMQHFEIDSEGRTTRQMWDKVGVPVSHKYMKPGDMIFWDKGRIHHVGMYVGGGKYIQAPYAGSTVRVSKLSDRKAPIASVRRPQWETYTVLPSE